MMKYFVSSAFRPVLTKTVWLVKGQALYMQAFLMVYEWQGTKQMFFGHTYIATHTQY